MLLWSEAINAGSGGPTRCFLRILRGALPSDAGAGPGAAACVVPLRIGAAAGEWAAAGFSVGSVTTGGGTTKDSGAPGPEGAVEQDEEEGSGAAVSRW